MEFPESQRKIIAEKNGSLTGGKSTDFFIKLFD